jgi:FkbM family methyltransferase
MNLKAALSSLIYSACRRLGYEARFHRLPFNDPSLDGALRRLSAHQIAFNSLIDVGASDGSWSKAFAARFPGKCHLLVDANRIHLAALEALCQQMPNWQYRFTAVGEKKGTLYFDDSDPFGGHLSAVPYSQNYKPCAVNSVDDLVQETNLPAPYFLKLDTHGVELPILAGSTKTLENAKVLVIEAYNFTFGSPAVPFWELCRSLFELGFRPLDVFDILYREVDDAFWQFDLLFARADLPLFADSRFFIDKRH